MSTEKKFNPAKRKKLNNPIRLQWIPPQKIAMLLEMQEKGAYLDIGAGTGYISREVAVKVPGAVIHTLDIDGIWSITVFHELGDPVPLLREIQRVLQPGGRLLIIDWEKKVDACEQGPPLEHRVFVEGVIAVLQEVGFSNVEEVAGFTHHFGVLAGN